MARLIKDPNARLDFGRDWSAWLEDTETIVDSTWLAPDGLTIETPSVSGGKTIVWVTGGTVGQSYRLTNRITTSAGRIDDRSLTIHITER